VPGRCITWNGTDNSSKDWLKSYTSSVTCESRTSLMWTDRRTTRRKDGQPDWKTSNKIIYKNINYRENKFLPGSCKLLTSI
jgi:hypothetical protein